MARRWVRKTMPKKPESIGKLSGEIFEVAPTVPVIVPETTRLFRLTPASENLAEPHKQSAIVAANDEVQARALASAHDPFGRDWSSEQKYICSLVEAEERHVVGDVIFMTMPVSSRKS